MNQRQSGRATNGRLHFLAILLVTVLVMVLGVLVVVAPDRMGVPQITPSPAATPIASPSP